MYMTPHNYSSMVGKVSEQKDGKQVEAFGYIVASRPVMHNSELIDYAYVVSEHYGGHKIYFHNELTTDCFETASMRGH